MQGRSPPLVARQRDWQMTANFQSDPDRGQAPWTSETKTRLEFSRHLEGIVAEVLYRRSGHGRLLAKSIGGGVATQQKQRRRRGGGWRTRMADDARSRCQSTNVASSLHHASRTTQHTPRNTTHRREAGGHAGAYPVEQPGGVRCDDTPLLPHRFWEAGHKRKPP